jgi:hypothetical protein
MLAMDVNENAGGLNARGALTVIASLLAPTEVKVGLPGEPAS